MCISVLACSRACGRWPRVPSRSGRDADDGVAIDDLLLAACGVLHGCGGDAVGVSEGAFGVLVDLRNGVDREEVSLGSCEAEAIGEILAGVGKAGLVEREAVVDPRIQGAIATQGEAVSQLGQADKHERQEGAAVPVVVEQDVEMIHDVLVKEMRFVEKKDGVDALAPELLDMGGDGVEDGGGGCGRRQAHGGAELTIEVAATEGG